MSASVILPNNSFDFIRSGKLVIVEEFDSGVADATFLSSKTCRFHTYYVQFLCNRLYALKENTITESLVRNTLKSLLKENEPVYINYRNLLTDYQWKVLTAVAIEGNAQLITSKDFISKHNLGTPSSVHSAVKSLLSKEMIYKEGNDYFIYDVFLERWLESKSS